MFPFIKSLIDYSIVDRFKQLRNTYVAFIQIKKCVFMPVTALQLFRIVYLVL